MSRGVRTALLVAAVGLVATAVVALFFEATGIRPPRTEQEDPSCWYNAAGRWVGDPEVCPDPASTATVTEWGAGPEPQGQPTTPPTPSPTTTTPPPGQDWWDGEAAPPGLIGEWVPTVGPESAYVPEEANWMRPYATRFSYDWPYEDGVNVVVRHPEPFVPSSTADGADLRVHAISALVTITNEGSGPVAVDPVVTVTAGTRSATHVYDPGNDVVPPEPTTLAPGGELTWWVGAGVNTLDRACIAVAPSARYWPAKFCGEITT